MYYNVNVRGNGKIREKTPRFCSNRVNGQTKRPTLIIVPQNLIPMETAMIGILIEIYLINEGIHGNHTM